MVLRSSIGSHGCSEFRTANRVSRRQFLQVGSLSAFGMGLSDIQSRLAIAQQAGLIAPKPRAKACIFLFMWGGPSQLDTFDMKPDAPSEIRGDFNPIDTRVPGIQICEHFSRVAQVTDKLAIIRSLCHDDPAHLSSGHATLTGQLAPVVKSDADPPSSKDSPHLGALLAKLRPSSTGIPAFVAMPWKALHPAAPGGESPGQHGGWLGSAYDGMLLQGDLNHPDWRPQGLGLPAEMTLDHMSSRVELLRKLDGHRGAAAVYVNLSETDWATIPSRCPFCIAERPSHRVTPSGDGRSGDPVCVGAHNPAGAGQGHGADQRLATSRATRRRQRHQHPRTELGSRCGPGHRIQSQFRMHPGWTHVDDRGRCCGRHRLLECSQDTRLPRLADSSRLGGRLT